MTTSRPARRAGIDSDWTSLGEVIFCRVSDARTRVLTPASANVCNEAPRCLSFLSYLPRSTGSLLGQEERTRAGDARCVEGILPDRETLHTSMATCGSLSPSVLSSAATIRGSRWVPLSDWMIARASV